MFGMLMTPGNAGFGKAPASAAAPGALASRFDGSNDLIGLTDVNAGIADAAAFTGSVWFRFPTASTFRFFFKVNGLGTSFDLSVQADGRGLIRLQNTASTNIFQSFFGNSGANRMDDGDWHHIAFSANTSTGERDLFVDEAQVTSDTGIPTGSDVDLAAGTYAFPQATSVDVDLSEIWMGEEYIDLAASNPFISGGLPTDLGADGSLATGTQPPIYSKAADGVNAGSGADFTVTGAPEAIAGPGA